MKVVQFEGSWEDIDDGPLEDNNDGDHQPKQEVVEHTFENVELVIDFSAVEEVEDLHEDKYIVDKGDMS